MSWCLSLLGPTLGQIWVSQTKERFMFQGLGPAALVWGSKLSCFGFLFSKTRIPESWLTWTVFYPRTKCLALCRSPRQMSARMPNNQNSWKSGTLFWGNAFRNTSKAPYCWVTFQSSPDTPVSLNCKSENPAPGLLPETWTQAHPWWAWKLCEAFWS